MGCWSSKEEDETQKEALLRKEEREDNNKEGEGEERGGEHHYQSPEPVAVLQQHEQHKDKRNVEGEKQGGGGRASKRSDERQPLLDLNEDMATNNNEEDEDEGSIIFAEESDHRSSMGDMTEQEHTTLTTEELTPPPQKLNMSLKTVESDKNERLQSENLNKSVASSRTFSVECEVDGGGVWRDGLNESIDEASSSSLVPTTLQSDMMFENDKGGENDSNTQDVLSSEIDMNDFNEVAAQSQRNTNGDDIGDKGGEEARGEPLLTCTECSRGLPKSSFSGAQLKKKKTMACKECIAAR